jgi:hypothetical protein
MFLKEFTIVSSFLAGNVFEWPKLRSDQRKDAACEPGHLRCDHWSKGQSGTARLGSSSDCASLKRVIFSLGAQLRASTFSHTRAILLYLSYAQLDVVVVPDSNPQSWTLLN